MSLKRFPFGGIGVLLIAISVSPTAVGFVRAVNQFPKGESFVALAFHPAMIACANISLLLIVIGIVRSWRQRVP